MSTINDVFRNIEDLISKASKANTEMIAETAKFLGNLDKGKINRDYILKLNQALFSEAVNKITALNIKYTTELINIGVGLSKKLNETSVAVSSADSDKTKSSVSAFELKASGFTGGTATTAFLLNSDKNEPILCKVLNASFQREDDQTKKVNFKVTYTPQLFELQRGIAQRVDAVITIPSKATPGNYKSRISVEGFEHTHFDVALTVSKAAVKKRATRTPVKSSPAKRKTPGSTAKKTATSKKPVSKRSAPARKKTTNSKSTNE